MTHIIELQMILPCWLHVLVLRILGLYDRQDSVKPEFFLAPRNEGKTLEEENVLPGNTLTVVVAPRQRCVVHLAALPF